jgi:hypothetical protein
VFAYPAPMARGMVRTGTGAPALLLLIAAAALAGVAEDHPQRADVVAVEVSGEPGTYRFLVSVRSPDEGCDRFARWWEVVSPDGRLLYRRILMHSHPDEQPFARAGGPVPIGRDEEVVVRAWMHPDGYGGAMLRGSVAAGFSAWRDAPPGFAADLARVPPQPDVCWR